MTTDPKIVIAEDAAPSLVPVNELKGSQQEIPRKVLKKMIRQHIHQVNRPGVVLPCQKSNSQIRKERRAAEAAVKAASVETPTIRNPGDMSEHLILPEVLVEKK